MEYTNRDILDIALRLVYTLLTYYIWQCLASSATVLVAVYIVHVPLPGSPDASKCLQMPARSGTRHKGVWASHLSK